MDEVSFFSTKQKLSLSWKRRKRNKRRKRKEERVRREERVECRRLYLFIGEGREEGEEGGEGREEEGEGK